MSFPGPWGAALGLLLALPAVAAATDHAIFVDGSYSPGEDDSSMDRLLDGRLDEADRIFGERSPGSERRTVGSKEDLQRALKGIKCGCDDTVTLVLMGHGEEDEFKFSKARGEDRTLSAEELASWVEDTAVECCCKIHVVIFACHSGSFLDDLLARDHVGSVYASSRADESSYSDTHRLANGTLFDGGDWMRGFLEDWDDLPRNVSLADALARSSESAEEEMPDRYIGSQHPRGWRRGRLPVVAHVERRPRRGKLEVHVFEPEFMRSETIDLDVEEVELPEDLRPSNWIAFTGDFDEYGGGITIDGDVTPTDPPTQRILAHIEKKPRKAGKRFVVEVHTIHPKWLHCKRQRVYFDDESQLPVGGLQPCNWIRQELDIEDPESSLRTDQPFVPFTPTFPAKAHVTGTKNYERGTFKAHILEPAWLAGQSWEIQLPRGERGRLRSLERCRNVLIDLEMRSTDGRTLPGSNLRLIHTSAEVWDVPSDVALNQPLPLDYSLAPGDEEWRIFPRVGVTNVGTETVRFPVRAAIGRAADEESLEAALRQGAAVAEALWQAEASVGGLAPGETVAVEFEGWSPPEEGGRFWIGFHSALENDRNPLSDTADLLFDVPPLGMAEAQDTEERSPPSEPFSGHDLGTLAPGTYNFPVTAQNISCKGKHDFRVSFEPADESTGEWLRITGPDTLTKIKVGAEKTTRAVLELENVGQGELRGMLRVKCLTCPPPPTCVQNLTEIPVRVVVRAP